MEKKISEKKLKKLSNFFIFSQKKAFLIFWETETSKKFLVSQETELSYILGKGNPKKLLLFQEVTFRARKKKPTPKKLLIFRGMKLSSLQKVNKTFFKLSTPKKP